MLLFARKERQLLSQSEDSKLIMLIVFCTILGLLLFALIGYYAWKWWKHRQLMLANKPKTVTSEERATRLQKQFEEERQKRLAERRELVASLAVKDEAKRAAKKKKKEEEAAAAAAASEDDETSDSLDLDDIRSRRPGTTNTTTEDTNGEALPSTDSTTSARKKDKKKKKKDKKNGKIGKNTPAPALAKHINEFTSSVVHTARKGEGKHVEKNSDSPRKNLKKKHPDELVVDIAAFRKDVGLPDIESGLMERRLERRQEFAEARKKKRIKGLLTPEELRNEEIAAKMRLLGKQEAAGGNVFGIV